MFIPSSYNDHATKHQAHSQQINEIKFNVMPVNVQSLIIVIRACNYELNIVLERTYNHRRVPFITYFFLLSLFPSYAPISPFLCDFWNNLLHREGRAHSYEEHVCVCVCGGGKGTEGGMVYLTMLSAVKIIQHQW